ncbi:hypothetical protein HY405_00530 [Candidatus Microgenomates bacterium]|nr:hypothetical protein [Candidatus Microgenomates bacterium]
MQISILSESAITDIRVHQNLVKKILFPKRIAFKLLEKVNFHGKNDLLSNLPTAISVLTNKFSELDLIIIVVDSDKLPASQQKKEILEIIKKVDCFPINKIVVGVAQKNIEAWLLTDENALNKVLLLKIKGVFKKAENIIKPKIKMRELYGSYCKFLKEQDKKPLMYSDFLVEISNNVDINNLCKKSSSFNSFAKEVRNAAR